jgi:CheY-like chemotaxis protein
VARNVLVLHALSPAAAAPNMPYVIVVDDTENIRDAVLEVLGEEGIRAIGFTDGAAALEHLRSGVELPIAILTDLMMPVLDGWQLVECLRGDARLSGIRVIAMTANPMCVGPHAVPLLRKPFHVSDLLGALEGG